jgi:cell division protein FtsB
MMQGLMLPAACTGLVCYFGWHALYGDYGLLTIVRFEERISLRQAELQSIRADQERLQRRVALMRPGQLDADMLDELARVSLGYSRPDEITIIYTP